MQPFVHSQVNKLNAALNSLEIVTNKYINRQPDLAYALLCWLDDTVQSYKQLGQLDRESQLLLLKAEMVTAQRGVNPASFEKVTTHRQELQSNTAFKILQTCEGILRSDLEIRTDKIREAETLIRQVVIAGFQQGIITQDLIRKIKKQAHIESLWRRLSQDPNIVLGQTRILLLVSKYDVWILLGDLLDRLRPAGRRRNTTGRAAVVKPPLATSAAS